MLGLDRPLRLLQRVRPGGLVLLGGVHRRQPALGELGGRHELGVAAEHDVGASAGHVGGDGDGALAAGLRDDLRLTLVLLGVEDLVRDAATTQQGREQLGLLDAGRADEHRLALVVALDDVLDDGFVLRVLGAIDEVRLVDAPHRAVGRDRHDAELVDLVQLGGLGHGRTGHAGELVVEPEVVLQRDRGERLVLVLDLDALLGLDGLVHALVVATARKHAAGVLVDDQDLAVHDDVVLVGLEELLGLDRVVEVADERGVDALVEVLDAELVLDLGDAGLEDADGALLLVDLVVAVDALLGVAALEAVDDQCELGVPVRGLVGRAADDQRRARLVDEDRVDLVHDGVVVAALDEVVLAPRHVVAQVVEAELVVGAVGDVAGVLLAALVGAHRVEDDADAQPEEPVDAAHPLGVALGEVVVDRDDVDALAGQRVEVGRERPDEGLALTGLHLRDVAEVQRRAAHELDVVVPLAEGAASCLADDRERLRQEVVEGLAVGVPRLELVGLLAQLVVAQALDVVLEGVDLCGQPLELADDLALAGAQDLVEDRGHAGSP